MIEILLIEDNPDDIELAQRAFESLSLSQHVQVAHDGAEGLDYLFGRGTYATSGAAQSVRMVLLDLDLPKTSGLEVLRQIRRDPSTKQLPIIVLTVSKKEPDLLQSFTMGISDYMIKPLRADRFSKLYAKYRRMST